MTWTPPQKNHPQQQWQPEALTLTRRECALIEQAAQQLLIRTGGFPLDPNAQVLFSRQLGDMIEDRCRRLGEALARLRCEHAHEALVVHGLPVREDLAVPIQLACSSLIGTPFNYAEQNNGTLAMRLEPTANSAPNTNTTAKEFALHSDDAAVPEALRAAWLSLYGIRNPRGTLTGYAPIRIVEGS
jgi:hypothetical protein